MLKKQILGETRFREIKVSETESMFIIMSGKNDSDSKTLLKKSGYELMTHKQADSTYSKVLLSEAQKYCKETGEKIMWFYANKNGGTAIFVVVPDSRCDWEIDFEAQVFDGLSSVVIGVKKDADKMKELKRE